MTEESREEIERILAELVDRRARGETPRREEYLERHPRHREEILRQFDALDALDSLASASGRTVGASAAIGDFRIVRELGRGGMGTVFLAEQISLHRPVALKLLAAPLAQSYRSFERFRREAEVAARLHHPNLVSVYAVGEGGGHHFIAMEYVEGPSLAWILRRLRERGRDALGTTSLHGLVREWLGGESDRIGSTPVPARQVGYFGVIADLIAHVADALAYAHERGVVHRDVKPQNILLGLDLNPFLADFGLAKHVELESLTLTGDLVGSPHYMSPELAMAGRIPIDHRTDVYSLGVTLFELLTLSVPFAGPSSHEVLRKIVLEPAPFPRRLNPTVPRDLQVIALKAMEKNPSDRYGSAAEMAEDLRRFLRFEPIRAKPPGPIAVAARFVRRNRVAASAATIAALGLAAGGLAIRAESRRSALESRLAACARAEDASDWITAKGEYRAILADFGDGVPEARDGLARVEAAIEGDFGRLVATGDRHLERARASVSREYEFVAAFRDYQAALALRTDPRVEARRDEAVGVYPVTIASSPAGGRVTLHPVEVDTGRRLPGEDVGVSPIESLPLPLGEYWVVVEADGLGFGEYWLAVDRGAEARRLDVVIRPTEEVVRGMVLVPGGRHRIGFDPGPDWPERMPVMALEGVEVDVAPFYIDATEVSNAEYAAFTTATGHRVPPHWEATGGTFPTETGDHPVFNVSWMDAQAFAAWAGKRLPTEIEWETACRWTDGRTYPWGDDWDPERANFNRAFPQVPTGAPFEPVDAGREGANPFGLRHLVGNVAEWIWEPWVPRAGERERQASPPHGERVIRGGSVVSPDSSCSCVARNKSDPDGRYGHIGVRCVKAQSRPAAVGPTKP